MIDMLFILLIAGSSFIAFMSATADDTHNAQKGTLIALLMFISAIVVGFYAFPITEEGKLQPFQRVNPPYERSMGEVQVSIPDILEEVQLEMAVPTDNGNVTVVFRLNSRTGDVDIIKIIPMS